MQRGILGTVVATSLVAALSLAPTSANAQANNLVDLGVATGYGVNNAGQAALGQSGIYSGGTTTPLPALSGQTAPASAFAINATGQVAGIAVTQVIIGGYGATGTELGSVPIEYSAGTLTNISTLLPFYLVTTYVEPGTATGINASGQIVGYYQELNPRSIDQPPTYGFIDSNGTATELPSNPPGAGTEYPPINMPLGINDNGQIVGTVAVADPNNPPNNKMDAYIYNSNNGAWIDLGTGVTYAINASGQATGTLTTTSGTGAFLYNNGTTTNLSAALGTQGTGYAINVTGQVVGSSYFSGISGAHAFFYNGVMTDLNTLIDPTDPLKPYVTLYSAVGINDSLLILANGVDSRTGLTHAYLLQAPFIQVQPVALIFGTEAVGGTTAPQSSVVTNAGTAPIPLGSASVSSNFSIRTNGCGASLAAGAQCTITVAFTPTAAGALKGGLTIPSRGANFVVPLSGVAPITATIAASSSTATVGKPITITWVSSPGSTCTAADSSLNPSFNGSIAPSGSKALTETAAGTVYYGLHCTATGTPEVDPVTTVVWVWPAVTATLSASPTTITAGQSTTLTWTSSNATSCSGTGGASGDNWAGTKATSGSQMVTEPFAPANPSVTVTFGITCTSKASGLSGSASANVVDNQSAPAKKSGGGGGFDLLSLIALSGAVGLRRRRIVCGRIMGSRRQL